jgi:hypothetical protein
MKQTAVEWYSQQHLKLLIKLENKELSIGEYVVQHQEILNQAKEMEREQIIDAYQQAEKDNGKDFLNGDLYYNETFKSGKQSYQDKMRDKITKAKSRIKWNL